MGDPILSQGSRKLIVNGHNLDIPTARHIFSYNQRTLFIIKLGLSLQSCSDIVCIYNVCRALQSGCQVCNATSNVRDVIEDWRAVEMTLYINNICILYFSTYSNLILFCSPSWKETSLGRILGLVVKIKSSQRQSLKQKKEFS